MHMFVDQSNIYATFCTFLKVLDWKCWRRNIDFRIILSIIIFDLACQPPLVSCQLVKHLEPLFMSCLYLRTSASQNQAQITKNMTSEQKQQIINECVEEHFSPADIAKKWGCNPDTIRTWIRKAGKTLPKTYKKSAYSDTAPASGYDSCTLSSLSDLPASDNTVSCIR